MSLLKPKRSPVSSCKPQLFSCLSTQPTLGRLLFFMAKKPDNFATQRPASCQMGNTLSRRKSKYNLLSKKQWPSVFSEIHILFFIYIHTQIYLSSFFPSSFPPPNADVYFVKFQPELLKLSKKISIQNQSHGGNDEP